MTFSAYAEKELKKYFHGNNTQIFNEYLKQHVYNTFPRCQVNKVQKFKCPQMYGMYLLRKEEMLLENGGVKEFILYHVTTEQKGLQSLENGLDWRRTIRSRFGVGVSFSDDADYADYHASHSNFGEKRVIIVCTVLVLNISTVNPKWGGYTIIPPGNRDTTMSPNCRVYVKYNDYEFYPLYLMYYRKPDPCQSYYFNNNNRIRKQKRSVEMLTAERLKKQQKALHRFHLI